MSIWCIPYYTLCACKKKKTAKKIHSKEPYTQQKHLHSQVAAARRRGAVAQGVVTYSNMDASQGGTQAPTQGGGVLMVGENVLVVQAVQPVQEVQQALQATSLPPQQQEQPHNAQPHNTQPHNSQHESQRLRHDELALLEVGCTQDILQGAPSTSTYRRYMGTSECLLMLQELHDRGGWAHMTVRVFGWGMCVCGWVGVGVHVLFPDGQSHTHMHTTYTSHTYLTHICIPHTYTPHTCTHHIRPSHTEARAGSGRNPTSCTAGHCQQKHCWPACTINPRCRGVCLVVNAGVAWCFSSCYIVRVSFIMHA